jgi:two-component system LytT family response regulator
MKFYSAIIVDDEINAVHLLEASLKILFPEIVVSAKCTHWKDALRMFKENIYDMVFLDISMPEKSGMDLLKLLPQVASEIIFVTAHQEFAVEAFKFQATAYILKPYSDEDLSHAVNMVITKIEGKKTTKHGSYPGKSAIIAIPDTKGIEYIHLSNIIYFQADHKCTKIVLKDRVLYSSYHLGLFKKELSDNGFFEAHRSYLINYHATERYIPQTSTIIMSDKSEVPLAKSAKEAFLNLFLAIGKHKDPAL